MRKILKDFIDNDEAMDAYIDSKTTYISLEDVETLLDRQEKQLTLTDVVCSATIKDVADGTVIIDMRGSEKWGSKLKRLRHILKKAAPKTEKEPKYTFTPFYYCENGYWYESTWRKTGSVPVLDIVD